MRDQAEGNFAGRIVQRLGPTSQLIDAAAGETSTPQDLARLIAGCAEALVAAGLRKGDRVLIGCSLSPSCAFVYLGAIYAGLVAVPVVESLLAGLLPALLKATGAAAVWSEARLESESADGRPVQFLHGRLSPAAPRNIPPVAVAESDLAALMATSGTTGSPRFVMVTHGNLIANTEAIIRSQQLGADDRAMMVLPLNYCFGASLLHTHLYAGGSVVMDRRFMFPDKVLSAVVDFGCTTFAGVPTAYTVLLKRSNIRKLAMPSLRRFLQAGGHLPVEQVNEMRAIAPAVKFFVMYGQTEATARVSCMEPERWNEKQGSVGRPLDKVAVRIIDEEANALPAGSVGQLCVRGPSISPGYWNESKETRRVFRDGWLHTGDLARQDEEGYLWIHGRQGAFLKMRGVRVSFAEAETMVAAMPGVYECAACAVAHADAGEALQLFIVAHAGATVAAGDVRRHLPAHWALDSVHLVSELPKTSTGKIARASLQNLQKGAQCRL